jgi:hypothetical protein
MDNIFVEIQACQGRRLFKGVFWRLGRSRLSSPTLFEAWIHLLEPGFCSAAYDGVLLLVYVDMAME